MSKSFTGKTMQCKHCKKMIYIPKNRLASFKYCSRTCKALATRIQITSNCSYCGNNFFHISSRCNVAKYCSRKCYYKAQTKKGSIKCFCKHCEKEFFTSPSKKRIYCSKKCVNKPKLADWNPDFQSIRKNMQKRNMIKKCERCGYNSVPEILGIHHKDRNRKNNKISNLEILCPTCHSLEHIKHICHSSKK